MKLKIFLFVALFAFCACEDKQSTAADAGQPAAQDAGPDDIQKALKHLKVCEAWADGCYARGGGFDECHTGMRICLGI